VKFPKILLQGMESLILNKFNIMNNISQLKIS
jgi:hypothetical protein